MGIYTEQMRLVGGAEVDVADGAKLQDPPTQRRQEHGDTSVTCDTVM